LERLGQLAQLPALLLELVSPVYEGERDLGVGDVGDGGGVEHLEEGGRHLQSAWEG